MPAVLTATIVIILDQITKFYICKHMTEGMSIPIVPDIFHLTYILNAGAAFGLLENQRFFFIAIAVVLLGVLVKYYAHIPPTPPILRIGVGLMAGGAIGNLIDRIKSGQVVDFFDFRIWPIFNIADMAIVVGVSIIIYNMFTVSVQKDETA